MRLLPGVLGNEASSQYESFGLSNAELSLDQPPEDDNAASPAGSGPGATPPSSTHGAGGLLDYPHYTRPVEFQGLAVPEVLIGGNHDKIRRWRRERALEKTLKNRPDLLDTAELTEQDRNFLRSLGVY
jgi:tRNA (guanine37-N1)-methyltransferase